jgi:hypothetical protein
MSSAERIVLRQVHRRRHVAGEVDAPRAHGVTQRRRPLTADDGRPRRTPPMRNAAIAGLQHVGPFELEIIRVIDTPEATHIRYRVSH